jgi:hypothetical protein
MAMYDSYSSVTIVEFYSSWYIVIYILNITCKILVGVAQTVAAVKDKTYYCDFVRVLANLHGRT